MSSTTIENTFGIAATADRYCLVCSEAELRSLLADPALTDRPCLILGGGSNMVFTRHFPGTIIHLENKGISLSLGIGGKTLGNFFNSGFGKAVAALFGR